MKREWRLENTNKETNKKTVQTEQKNQVTKEEGKN
jgi:hypothetical protein